MKKTYSGAYKVVESSEHSHGYLRKWGIHNYTKLNWRHMA